MSFLQKAREKASEVARDAADASAKAAGAVAAKAQDPATQAKVKGGMVAAGRGARTMVERIDPGILADVIIKATALQEKANASLRRKGSIYRIGEIQVTASLPPGISFSIERVGDADAEAAAGALHTSAEILASDVAADAAADPTLEIVSLDGEEQAAIAFEIAETEASMEAAVAAIEAAETDSAPA